MFFADGGNCPKLLVGYLLYYCMVKLLYGSL